MSNNKKYILADENMPALSACFSSFAIVKTLAGRDIKPQDLKHSDALLVRSITQVTETLLAGSPLKFVGSATIGTDHIDQDFLARKGIHFTHAPGSNAQSVVEYVITAIAYWCQKKGRSPEDLSIGIIGCGQIGSRLALFFDMLGMKYQCCDPLLENKDQAGKWCDMSEINKCDVITCHVPLTQVGPYATHHLIDDAFIAEMKPNSLLINSARGAVVDNKALLVHLKKKKVDAVLDVWETEPVIDTALMDAVFLATPHIAGYAYEAKIRGTFMLYLAYCEFYNFKQTVAFEDLLPFEPLAILFDDVTDWVNSSTSYYDILADDRNMRESLKTNPQVFDLLRKNYPLRREFLKLSFS